MFRIFICGLYFLGNYLFAQSPIADFTLPSNACINQNILAVNNSSNANTYLWDYCEGELLENPIVTEEAILTGSFNTMDITIALSNNLWYGFVTSRNTNSIIRLDFGTSLNNSPTQTNLGNLNNTLLGPEQIKLVSENSNWYGIVLNSGNSSLIRLSFGNDLSNIPSVELACSTIGIANSGMDLKIDNQEKIVIVTNYNTNIVEIINFGISITNNPQSGDKIVTAAIVGVAGADDISIIYDGTNWYGLLAGFNSKTIHKLSFGSSLFSMPSATNITGISIGAERPASIQIARDNGQFIAFIQTVSGKILRWNFGVDFSTNTPNTTELGDFGVLQSTVGIELIYSKSEWFAFSIASNIKVYKLDFPNNCSTSQPISEETEPIISYSEPGEYYISLKATDEFGNVSYHVDTINITTNTASPISITSQNVCQSSPIQFSSTSSSGGLTYSWDFGDTNTSTVQNPSHSYATAGEYEVTLSVEDGTCGNFTRQTIKIYDEPIPDFTVPGGNICTNQPYSFVNTTLDNFDGFLTYEWQLDGVSVGTSRDLGITFLYGGTKELKLIATIPGCSIENAKNLTSIKEGILPQFTFDDSCVGELVTFSNTSVGTPTNITWNFGNGFNSSLANPSLEYNTDGTYDVTMTLTNADGCVTFDTQTITIHPLPSVNFSNELACEMLETQFNDLSSVTLDNLSSWTWDFDDQSTNSTDQNPLHSFAMAGDFNVKLITESTFGCIDSLQQTVTVFEAPDAAFSLDKICLDVPIQFTDESVPIAGENIVDWAWNLGGIFNNNQNPQLTFNNALDYNISLTVTSENLCTSTQSQSISIGPVPTVAFEVSDDCENQIAILTDVTSISVDNINQWNWNLGSSSIGSGNQISNKFSNAGNYDVTLSILTEKGCDYEVIQTVPIYEVPVAAFSPSFPFGAPPFIVDFSNQSTGATNYSWSFEEGANSLESEPSYTFQNLGDFDVQLVAINDQNCSDTTTRRIEVLQPLLDLEVRNLSLIPSINADILSITVRNNGTIRMDSLRVGINLGGELELFEKINTRINPDETITAQLSLQLVNKKLDYICVSIASYLVNVEDNLISNNDKCVTFNNQDIIIFPPYPNPVNNEVKFEVITTTNQSAVIEIINSRGVSVSTFENKLESGHNNLVFNMEALVKGLYLIRMNIGGKKSVFKVVLEK